MSSKWYMIDLHIHSDGQHGVDIVSYIGKVKSLLCSSSAAAKHVHVYKVTGESRVVAVFEVYEVSGLERITAGIARLGHSTVECRPLLQYKKYAVNFLGVTEELAKPPENTIQTDTELYWLHFDVDGYPGKSMDELIDILKQEATAALTLRSTVGHLEIYKDLFQLKVHAFVQMEPYALDTLSFTLPVMKHNGSSVKIVAKHMQELNDYCTKMSAKHK